MRSTNAILLKIRQRLAQDCEAQAPVSVTVEDVMVCARFFLNGWQAGVAGGYVSSLRKAMTLLATHRRLEAQAVGFSKSRCQDDDAAQREMVEAASGYYRALKGESTSALTHLQALEVARSWLHLSLVRFWHAKVSFAGPATSKAGPHWDRRLTSAQRRFDRAMKTMAETQRLLARVPHVQINIAQQQVVGQ